MPVAKRITILTAVLCLTLAGQSLAGVSEYELKAALLFKVARFVQWPPAAFENRESTHNICILGENRFGDAVDSWRGKTIHGRPVAVRTMRRLDAGDMGCHVLFVSDSERDRVPEILSLWEGRPVLTIADFDGFAAAGGVMTFVNANNRIRFEINAVTSREAGLQVSAQLMQLATIVPTAGGAQ